METSAGCNRELHFADRARGVGEGKRFPCVAVCQHDVRKFSGQAVLGALRAHADILDASIGLLLK